MLPKTPPRLSHSSPRKTLRLNKEQNPFALGLSLSFSLPLQNEHGSRRSRRRCRGGGKENPCGWIDAMGSEPSSLCRIRLRPRIWSSHGLALSLSLSPSPCIILIQFQVIYDLSQILAIICWEFCYRLLYFCWYLYFFSISPALSSHLIPKVTPNWPFQLNSVMIMIPILAVKSDLLEGN